MTSNGNDSGSGFSKWTRAQKVLIATISTQQLFIYACLSNMAAFFPLEASLKDVSGSVIGLIFSCNALTNTLFSPIVGRFIIPKLGKKSILIGGCWLAGGATVLFGLLDEIEHKETFVAMCFTVRIVEALGVSMFITAGFAFLSHAFRAEIGFVMGFSEMGVGVGVLLGPTIGGFLYEAGGFKLPFFTLGLILLSTIPISMWILPSEPEPSRQGYKRIVGADSPVTLSSGERSDASHKSDLQLATRSKADFQRVNPETGTSASMTEISASSAGISQQAKKSRCWANVEIGFFVCYVTVNAVTISFFETTLEPHLRPLGMNPRQVGLFFMISSFCYLIFGIAAGYVADRFERGRGTICSLGMFFQAGAFILLGPSPVLGLDNMFGLNAAALAIMGVSFAFAVIPTFAIMFDVYGKHHPEERDRVDDVIMYSTVSGIWQSAYSFGEFIGPAVGGVLVEHLEYPASSSIVASLCLFWSALLGAVECCRSLTSDTTVSSNPRPHSETSGHASPSSPSTTTTTVREVEPTESSPLVASVAVPSAGATLTSSRIAS